MPSDRWARLAALLRPDEAAMIAGLLESAGIDAEVRDAGSAGVLPAAGLGGAEVLVPAADLERAREIVAASGILAGPGARGGTGEAPEQEWRAPAAQPTPEQEARRARAAEERLRLREDLWGRDREDVPGGLGHALLRLLAALLRGIGRG